MPFIAITERAASQLVNEQYAMLRRALSSAHERLEQGRPIRSGAWTRRERARHDDRRARR